MIKENIVADKESSGGANPLPNSEELKREAPESDPLQELTELLQRTQANFENYRKQTEKRIEDIKQMAAKDVIVQLLPLIDNFELALKNAHVHPEEFVKGIELIYSQLSGVLQQVGVKPIMTEKTTFDPYLHEALLKVESSQPANTILEEFQRGFTLHGQVIRHARVKISSGAMNKENKTKSTDTGGI